MKRLAVCVVILCSIAAVSVYSIFAVEKANDKLFRLIDSTAQSYRDGSENTKQMLDELEDYWREYYVKVSYLSQTCTLDDISYSVAKLPALLERDSEDFLSECESIKAWAKKIYDSQFPHLYSVF